MPPFSAHEPRDRRRRGLRRAHCSFTWMSDRRTSTGRAILRVALARIPVRQVGARPPRVAAVGRRRRPLDCCTRCTHGCGHGLRRVGRTAGAEAVVADLFVPIQVSLSRCVNWNGRLAQLNGPRPPDSAAAGVGHVAQAFGSTRSGCKTSPGSCSRCRGSSRAHRTTRDALIGPPASSCVVDVFVCGLAQPSLELVAVIARLHAARRPERRRASGTCCRRCAE